jgi:hypothetical protein
MIGIALCRSRLEVIATSFACDRSEKILAQTITHDGSPPGFRRHNTTECQRHNTDLLPYRLFDFSMLAGP